MSHLEVRRALETRLLAQLTASYPAVEIRWENDDRDETNEALEVAPQMYPGNSMRTGIGSVKPRRSHGRFQVEVSAAKDTATAERDAVAEFLGNYFAEKEYPVTGGRVVMGEPNYENMLLKNGRYSLSLDISYLIDTKGV